MGKAQTGMEYIFIFGFGLFVIVVLWSFSNTNIENTRWDLQLSYAKSAMIKMSQAADSVYIQGSPSQIYIFPNFPENVNRVEISSNTITFELLWQEGILRNISTSTIGNITGNVSRAHGTHKLLVKAQNSMVSITEV